MSTWLDLVYQLLPAIGLLLLFTSLIYLCMMRKEIEGVFLIFYIYHIFGFSLLFAGFHGILVSVYSSKSSDEIVPLFRCLFNAVHLHVWCFIDAAQLFLLLLLAVDQFISVIWSKIHKEISEYYFNAPVICTVVILSLGSMVPAGIQPISLVDNTTVRVPAYCWMEDVIGPDIYSIELKVRMWTPFAAIAVLAFTGCMLLGFQLHQGWSFKWADNNAQSSRHYFLVLVRALILAGSVHIPLIVFDRISKGHLAEELHPVRELAIRVLAALLLGIVHPVTCLLLMSPYRYNLAHFLNLTEQKRGWQSVDDPPAQRKISTMGSGFAGAWHQLFGSFKSTTGNIVGEAGIPYELNADEIKSVSFYYKD